MIIYCDESGGRNDDLFLVSAVRDFDRGTARAVRNIRKKLRISGELKGNKLSAEEMVIALREFEFSGEKAYVAALRKADPVHALVLNLHDDALLWEELIFQAVCLIYDGTVKSLKIIADGGRYSRKVLDDACLSLERRFANQLGLNLVEVICEDSQFSPGIQLADIVANSTYRALKYDPAIPAISPYRRVSGTEDIILAPRILFERMQPTWV